MRSLSSLRAWTQQLLPTRSVGAQTAGWVLLRSLLVQFTTHLTQLARQAERATSTKGARQYFARWLDRAAWEPTQLYAALPHLLPAVWAGGEALPLLIDWTHLGGGGAGWSVLQVSVPWQRRALPLYRAVTPRTAPEHAQTDLVLTACDWLTRVLPGPQARYVVVMDRGFPSKALVKALRARGWRFVLRVHDGWKMHHPDHQGTLRAAARAGRVGPQPQLFRDAVFGWRTTGPQADRHCCTAHGVWYQGVGHREPWFLLTTEVDAARAVALYRQRMQIEAEFRDLKGPWGLDELVHWWDGERVARFLAWVAVYEWRLAALWGAHQLQAHAVRFAAHGALSWIRLTREWIAHLLRRHGLQALDCL